MIEEVDEKNCKEFNDLVKKLWSFATWEDCRQDAKITKQFMYKKDNKYVGFLTASVREDCVAGCRTHFVAYLEGIFVLEEYRRQKIATELFEHFKEWANSLNICEIASDCEINNENSRKFHKSLGFDEVETLIHFKYKGDLL